MIFRSSTTRLELTPPRPSPPPRSTTTTETRRSPFVPPPLLLFCLSSLTSRLFFSSQGMYDIDGWTGFTFPGRGDKYSSFKWNFNCFTGVDYDAKVRSHLPSYMLPSYAKSHVVANFLSISLLVRPRKPRFSRSMEMERLGPKLLTERTET